MDTVTPGTIVSTMVQAGATKAKLSPTDLLIRGALSGGLLGIATSLALGAAVQTGQLLVGALIFPVGFVMIVLLGLELVTGSFALLPMAVMSGQAKSGQMLSNWSWVLLGNLIGSVVYGLLFVIATTDAWQIAPAGVAERVRQLAEAKTIGYAAFGAAGMLTVFVKAILCNWMVCMGVVMGMCSTSVIGRIAAAWMPILVFFAQGFEHTVVNMFIIPAGMMLGAKVSIADWIVWNLVPVTLGNLAGGFGLVALALFATFARKPAETAAPPALAQPAKS
ncbi:MAG TPA: formate/nitrite transporter family protein [Acetobacteraceae bacterium]